MTQGYRGRILTNDEKRRRNLTDLKRRNTLIDQVCIQEILAHLEKDVANIPPGASGNFPPPPPSFLTNFFQGNKHV